MPISDAEVGTPYRCPRRLPQQNLPIVDKQVGYNMSARPCRVEIDLLCDQGFLPFHLGQFISVRRRKLPNSVHPTLGGAPPALGSRHELMALPQRSDSQSEVSCFPVFRPRVDGCSTRRAKGQHAPVAAISDFYKSLGFTSQEAKLTGNKNCCSERRAGQHLAIGAMANVSGRGVNLGFVLETAAKTFSIDVHCVLRELRLHQRGTTCHTSSRYHKPHRSNYRRTH